MNSDDRLDIAQEGIAWMGAELAPIGTPSHDQFKQQNQLVAGTFGKSLLRRIFTTTASSNSSIERDHPRCGEMKWNGDGSFAISVSTSIRQGALAASASRRAMRSSLASETCQDRTPKAFA